LKSFRRIVVKVGTSTIINGDFSVNAERLDNLVGDVMCLRRGGKEVILVTSGAIGTGMGRMGMIRRPKDIPSQQAAAAVGQSLLMHAYEDRFSKYGQPIAQMLLTAGDVADRKRYINASYSLLTLLKYKVVPIINENDTVAVDEIKVGDNDTLSAHVTNLAEADLLIILSDTDGFYTFDPRKNADAKLIDVVFAITDEIEEAAGKKGTETGTGGMETKIKAAKIVTGSGETMVLANGSVENIASKILAGEEIGTIFLPQGKRMSGRKRWIAYSHPIKGTLQVDMGAYNALTRGGKSLLASGVIKAEGDFEFGDSVRCISENGKEFARGLVNYNSKEMEHIKGKRTDEIETILGYRYYDEVIHRDNLVMLQNNRNET